MAIGVCAAIQAQLRNFIPEMLKFSTGKSKPGWGKPECRPLWWPPDVPWANVRSDVRDEDEKKLVTTLSACICFIVVEHIQFFHGAIQLCHEIEAADCDRHQQ